MCEIVIMYHKFSLKPWRNIAEFEYAFKRLFQDDLDERRNGVDVLKGWSARSRKLPVAIECTRELLNISVKYMYASEKDEASFRMSCTLAITRFVNFHTEELQTSGKSRPVHELAKTIGIPKWIVDIRHQGTHGPMPDMSVLEGALDFCLQWLKDRFWLPQIQEMTTNAEQSSEQELDKETKEKVCKLILDYTNHMQANGTTQNGRPSNQLAELLKPLSKLLKKRTPKNYLADLLTEDGYLVPTKDQEEVLSITDESLKEGGALPAPLLDFWSPLLDFLNIPCLESTVVKSIIDKFSQISKGPAGPEIKEVTRYLIGWAKVLIGRAGATSVASNSDVGTPSPGKRGRRVGSWNKTVTACMDQLNTQSVQILPSLLPMLDDPPISASKRAKLLQVADLVVHGPNGLTAPVNGIPSDDEMERMIEAAQGSRQLERLLMKEKMEYRVSHEKFSNESFKPWSVSTALVDWSRIPLGVLPGQPGDPAIFELPTSSSNRRKRKFSSITTNGLPE